MLDNIKWMMAKNDAEKLLDLYESSKNFRPQIIDKLFEIKKYDKLLDIAQKDLYYREDIINSMLDDSVIDPQMALQVLGWLNISKAHKRLLQYIVNKFNKSDIIKIYESPVIDRVTKNSLENTLKEKDRKIKKELDNEDYMKMKMLIEDAEISVNKLSKGDSLIRDDDYFEQLESFIEKRASMTESEQIQYFSALFSGICFDDDEAITRVLTLVNLSSLQNEGRLKLLRELNNDRIYYPDYFQVFTQSKTITLDDFSGFLSRASLNDWYRLHFKTSVYADLFLLANEYNEFSWVKRTLSKQFALADNMMISNYEYSPLITRFGYRLYHLSADEKIKSRLQQTSLELHATILNNMGSGSFDVERYLKPMLMVGGGFNYKFIKQLLQRKMVADHETAIHEIEDTFMELKKRVDDPLKLAQLIQQEVIEKSNLIAEDMYRRIARFYLSYLNESPYLPLSEKKDILENLPDLEILINHLREYGKNSICMLIRKLKLTESKQILVNFLDNSDYNLAISASAGLKSMGDKDQMKRLVSYAESNNFNVRIKLAEILIPDGDEQSEMLSVKLAKDENAEVSCASIKNVIKMPQEKALRYLTEIVQDSWYRNRIEVAKALSGIASIGVIPLLVELTREENTSVMLEVIKTLGRIKDKLAILVLKNLNLNRIPVLEIERAASLIKLGDYDGWEKLINYMDINYSAINNLSKITFLQLATAEHQEKIRELTYDSSPFIANLAAAKLLLYSEEEGWTTLSRFLSSDKNELKYFLIHLLIQIPFSKAKGMLEKISQCDDYSCKALTAIVFAINGDSSGLDELTQSALKLDDIAQGQLIKAIHDFPTTKTLPLLEKLASLQNPDNFGYILKIMSNNDEEYLIDFIKNNWKRADSNSKKEIVRMIGNVKHNFFINFIYDNIAKENHEIIAEMAYSLIMQGDDNGWQFFNSLLNNENINTVKTAIEVISRLQNKKAFDLIVQNFNNVNENIQTTAIKALGAQGMQEAVPHLQRFLGSSSDKIKMAVAKALGDLPYKESRKLLELLTTDSNEYIRTLTAISLEKHEKSTDFEYDYFEIFRSVFGKTEWKLNDYWFEKTFRAFAADYQRYQTRNLEEFKDKTILEEIRMDQKKEAIQSVLTDVLKGCSDINKIIKAKEEAKYQTEIIISKEELIKSILFLNDDLLSKDGWKMLWDAADMKDIEIIQALILASCRSVSINWLPIIEKTFLKNTSICRVDLLIYSLSKKKYTKTLSVLVLLLSSERARYYFSYYLNYYCANPEKRDEANLVLAVERLQKLKSKVAKAAEAETLIRKLIN